MATAIARRLVATVAGLLLLSCASSVAAKDWAPQMFNATSYNFGTVARGAKAEHRFTIENPYEEDIHILSVTSSCGCTAPQINKRVLKTWEKAELVAVIDTRNHIGAKAATITVKFGDFDAPEVQVHVYVYIRSDIVVQPGVIRFGTVNQGAEAKRDVSVSYAGRDDWRIERVECSNPHVKTLATETRRTPGSPDLPGEPKQPGLVNYSLSVALQPDTPPGYLQDQVVLVTNDPNPRTAGVPVSVEGVVAATLSVHPSSLLLGVTKPGKVVTGNLILTGETLFRILSAQSNDARFQCKITNDVKTQHVIPVTFLSKDSKAAAGVVNAKIRIETDMAGAPAVEAAVSAQLARPQPAER